MFIHRKNTSFYIKSKKIFSIFIFLLSLLLTTNFASSSICTQLNNINCFSLISFVQQGTSKLESRIKENKKPTSSNDPFISSGTSFHNFRRRRKIPSLPIIPSFPVSLHLTDTDSLPITLPISPKLSTGLVTFLTNVSKSEITVNGKNIGQTGNDKQLKTYLWLTLSEVTVTHPGYYLVTQIVDISENSEIIILNLEINSDATFKRFQDPQQIDFLTLEDWQRTEAILHTKSAEDPTDINTKARLLFSKGQIAFWQGDYLTAQNYFNETAFLIPKSAIVFYSIGNIYLKLNKPIEAQKAYQRAIVLNPILAVAYSGIGDALTKRRKFLESINYYDRALIQGYQSPKVHFSIARNLIQKRQWGRALSELLPFSKVAPQVTTFILIGDCYMATKQYSEAYAAYKQASLIDPRSTQSHYKVGEVLFKLKNYLGAKEAFEQSLQIDGDQINRAVLRKMLEKVNIILTKGKTS